MSFINKILATFKIFSANTLNKRLKKCHATVLPTLRRNKKELKMFIGGSSNAPIPFLLFMLNQKTNGLFG